MPVGRMMMCPNQALASEEAESVKVIASPAENSANQALPGQETVATASATMADSMR